MKKTYSEQELRELESQLSCPKGKIGIKVGNNMNETNMSMIEDSISYLDMNDNNVVLELGFGNCKHLNKLLSASYNVQYYGLEISETMLAEAQKINSDNAAKLNLYDGRNIPFRDDSFDRIVSVNTIYFWEDAIKLIKEIENIETYRNMCANVFQQRVYEKYAFCWA